MDEKSALKRLGDTLRIRRSDLGYSQEGFADSIGMHRAYYSSIERGARNITLGTMVRIADGLKVQASVLLQESGI
ncbi:MAG: helix-turn-helix transcriptional regulator [Arenimonas sp.]|nr:helix-turn-helix transcriptional regulator [Arenimonas sp.]